MIYMKNNLINVKVTNVNEIISYIGKVVNSDWIRMLVARIAYRHWIPVRIKHVSKTAKHE